MPKFEITSPDGKKFEITAPDGATEEQVLAYAQQQFSQPKPAGPSNTEVAVNAVPKGIANLLNLPATAGNMLIHGLTPPWLRSPSMKEHIPNYPMKGAEAIGLVDPSKNPVTPGQRILDTAIQSGIGALAGPGGLLRNAAVGTTAGAAGQTATELTGSPGIGQAVGMATPFALRSYSQPPARNPILDQTFQEGREAGYVVPPTRINPSFVNERLESLAGKAAINQEAAARNQSVTNALAARDIGVPPNTPLSEAVLNQVRQQAGQPYRDIANLSPQAAQTLEALRDARHEATAHWNHYNRTADPQSLRDARTYSGLSNQYEQDLANIAQQSGQPGLVQALAEARTRIARTHDVERSLNLGSGNVSAPIIGRQLDQAGLNARTGNLAVTGRMAQAFPQSMREASGVPSAGVSGTDAAMSAGLGLGGYGAAGPAGIAMAGLPLVRGPARALALSDWYQNRLLRGAVPPEGLGDTALRSALIANALAAQQGVQQ